MCNRNKPYTQAQHENTQNAANQKPKQTVISRKKLQKQPRKNTNKIFSKNTPKHQQMERILKKALKKAGHQRQSFLKQTTVY